MHPVLIVEGVAHKVESIDYLDGKPKMVIVEQDGRRMFYKDKSISANPNALDLEDAICWQGRYTPIYEALDNVISDECEELKNLATMYTESDIHSYKEKYKKLQQKVFGLIDAHELVTEFMLEDVDLSGGEEID